MIISGCCTALLEEVTKANPGIATIALDVASLENIKGAARELIKRYPDLSVVFNNAGFMPFDDVSGNASVQTRRRRGRRGGASS